MKKEISMFNKLFALIIVTACLCCTTALAQEQKGPSLADWLKVVQKKIDRIVPKKIQPLSTGVTGIRGTREDASVKLYWKGKMNEEPVITEAELSEFKKGIDLAVKGERTEAVKELQEFMMQYPDSVLIPDAKKTLDLARKE
jgi:TolA-binding protein